jgi:TolB-like protein
MLFLAIGFPFAVIFAWAFEMTPDGLKRESEVDRSESITPQTGKKLNLTIIAVLVLALGYFAFDKFVLTSGRDAALVEATTEAISKQGVTEEAPAESDKSIAVLPFVNMSSDSEQEFFSDGISEEILNALAKVKQLKVTGRTSSFAFKGKNQDLRQIGEALGVNHILEGSVRKAGTQVRITAQLIQVDNGFHLWSETYDRELTNVFAIQDEIATAILEQLKLQLLDTEKSALVATSTDTRAYEQYLLAKQRTYDRNLLSLEAAIELLDSAIAIDPDYAPAHAQHAIVVLLLIEDQYGEIPREEANPLAKGYIDKALLLDPGLAEAWAALGLYYLGLPSSHNEAIEALERALSINPNLIDASNWLQIAYGYAGQTGKVLPMLEDMLERDPLYRPVIGNAILEYNRLGMQEKSLAVIERARPFIPDDAHLVAYKARTFLTMGRFSEALPLVEEAVRRQPTDAIFKITLGAALFGLTSTNGCSTLSSMNSGAHLCSISLIAGKKRPYWQTSSPDRVSPDHCSAR